MTDQKPSHKIIEAAFIIPESFFISALRLHLRSAFRNVRRLLRFQLELFIPALLYLSGPQPEAGLRLFPADPEADSQDTFIEISRCY